MSEIKPSNENIDPHFIECPMCGSKNVQVAIETEIFEYGSGSDTVELKAQVPLHTCSKCDFEFTSEVAEIRRHEAVCNHLGILTPNEITTLRNRLGMSKVRFSKLTSLGAASIGRWERGVLFQNKACDKLLRLLQHRENIHFLQALEEDASEAATPVMDEEMSSPMFGALAPEAEKEQRKQAQIFVLRPKDSKERLCM